MENNAGNTIKPEVAPWLAKNVQIYKQDWNQEPNLSLVRLQRYPAWLFQLSFPLVALEFIPLRPVWADRHFGKLIVVIMLIRMDWHTNIFSPWLLEAKRSIKTSTAVWVGVVL